MSAPKIEIGDHVTMEHGRCGKIIGKKQSAACAGAWLYFVQPEPEAYLEAELSADRQPASEKSA